MGRRELFAGAATDDPETDAAATACDDDEGDGEECGPDDADAAAGVDEEKL